MSKSKNTTATVNTTATAKSKPTAKPTETVATVPTETVKNSAKTNVILNIDGVKKLFIECNVLPKYTDHDKYVATGIRSIVFSVNALKTKYNVYCDDIVFEILDNNKINGCQYKPLANSGSKLIKNTIEVDTTENLKKLLQLFASKYKMCTIA